MKKLLAAALLAIAASAQAEELSNGEVRKVDANAGKVTLKHEALPDLGMPAMTMVYRVKDPAMLDKLKEGDTVRFHAEKQDGKLTVTTIELAR